jgi:hypothetical protein
MARVRMHRILGFFGLPVLSVLLAFACKEASTEPTDDDSERVGSEGESCVRAADCAEGLACFGNVCSTNFEPMDDAGTGTKGQLGESCTSSVDCEISLSCIDNVCSNTASSGRGSAGESCAARRDCAAGLACINQTCAPPDDPDAGGPPDEVRGQRGESCRTRLDCETGLACVAGVCVIGDFDIEPTENECVLVQCREPTDCCPAPPTTCPSYRMLCDMDPVTYATYCTYWDLYCVCTDEQWDCVDDKCKAVVTCDDLTPCPGTLVCDDGECVQCVSSDDCAEGQSCVNATCTASCEIDEECPIFNACQNGGCVEVGCQTDRECVAFTKSVLATCGADGDCVQPCSSDFECSSPTNFTYRVCLNGTCVDSGCETDEECRIRLAVTAASGDEAECRPK